MYPTTNTRRKTVKTTVMWTLAAITILCFFWKRMEIFEMLTHTRSDGDVENTAPFMGLVGGAIIGGWVGIFAIMVIARLRHPNGSDINRFWVGQNRRREMAQLIRYPMISAIVCAYSAAIIVHLFA